MKSGIGPAVPNGSGYETCGAIRSGMGDVKSIDDGCGSWEGIRSSMGVVKSIAGGYAFTWVSTTGVGEKSRSKSKILGTPGLTSFGCSCETSASVISN